jgi:hypothetical protein
MASVLDFHSRARPAASQGSAWGLVTELVDTEQAERSRSRRGRKGVVHLQGLATVCIVEDVPAVGDLIRGEVAAIVEKVRVTREGRVLIYARPADAP